MTQWLEQQPYMLGLFPGAKAQLRPALLFVMVKYQALGVFANHVQLM
jgi:hypothetical protein